MSDHGVVEHVEDRPAQRGLGVTKPVLAVSRIDSMAFVDRNVWASVGGTPSRTTVSVSASTPSAWWRARRRTPRSSPI